jgi:hypothetical protein
MKIKNSIGFLKRSFRIFLIVGLPVVVADCKTASAIYGENPRTTP